MEELKEKRNDDDIFLHGICYVVLCVDSRIKFVGIVDSNGKLLIGKYREEPDDVLIMECESGNLKEEQNHMKFHELVLFIIFLYFIYL